MDSILNAVNQAVFSTSFSSTSSLSSSASIELLVSSALAKDTSSIEFTENSVTESLSSLVDAALEQSSSANLLTSLSQVGSYLATESLLITANDNSSAINEYI